MIDDVNGEMDKRKVQEYIANPWARITAHDIANAPVLAVSDCCKADLFGKDGDIFGVFCSKCRQKCQGVAE